MKMIVWRFLAVLLAFFSLKASATVRYVDLNSANPTTPYTNWSTAAASIQDAIDASTNGDTVLVTNGVYASGGRVMTGGLTNRVALDSAVTVQSVNGPWVTIIQGAGATNGPSAVRCAWLTNNATLIGFTLKWGSTTRTTDYNGGGVWCASSSAAVDNCVVVSNTADNVGSGVYQGTYNNCLISSNNGPMSFVGAAYGAVLNSCTVVSNSTYGVRYGSMTNCIVYYNAGENSDNTSVPVYCCTTPLPPGNGNFTNAPQLFVDGVHLLSTSPCIGAGANIVTGTDIFGNPWANPPSIGCAEYNPGPVITQPNIILTGNPLGFAVSVAAAGTSPLGFTWFKDGVPLQDNGHFSSTQTTNLVVTGVSLADAGNYQFVASNVFGVVTSAVTSLALHCVDAAGLSPVAPYSTWATAATNIQDAITASANGDIVFVTNGLYALGGMSMDGASTNRVTLNKAIRVQSLNGPWVTTIQGAGATNGTSAIRCAWLTNNAALVGFALEGGATQTSGNTITSESGGAVWCASSNAVVDNCAIIANTAYHNGAVYQGTLNNCLISSNSGAAGAVSAVYGAILNSCTIVSNTPNYAVFQCTLTNCIAYYNRPNGNNYGAIGTAAYCCTTPAITGPGNFTDAPQLQLDGVHLSSGSPCIETGTNVVTGTDIFGQAWANPPSVGCAEYNGLPMVSQPQITLTGAPAGFDVGNVALNGQPPLAFFWLENGIPLQNNGHFSSTQTTNLVATGVSLADAGSYQLVVSNAFGVVTSAVAQLVVHAVNAAGVNPQPPFLTWATAATNIQDAIEAAAVGDIVLVTNGVYDAGGEVMAGGLTNRVALDKSLMVTSVNGWARTIIRGAWDPVSTNGPAAVRCAWLTNGAVLSGFTLCKGATRNAGATTSLQSGGGVWCASTNALVSNCLLTNNCAAFGGGGIGFGTLNNSLVVNNVAYFGGGAYDATMNNCTVVYNSTTTSLQLGGGIYNSFVENCIMWGNQNNYFRAGVDNYDSSLPAGQLYRNSCSIDAFGQVPPGSGNISADPQFVDLYHISSNSPCRGAGSALYASGADLDGEPWNNPPSIGCAEVVVSNLVGPLSVGLTSYVNGDPLQTNVFVGHVVPFIGTITGRAAYVAWNFGDGPTITNADYYPSHHWTNTGTYTVVFTAYNNDNPAGISASMVMQVVLVDPPQLQSPSVLSNSIHFQFSTQMGANYAVQYATNLTPPVTWQTLEDINFSLGGVYQIQDSPATNAARFYRVQAQ